jgi:hypothetical protein
MVQSGGIAGFGFRRQRYNIGVSFSQIHTPSPERQTDSHKHHRPAVYASEAAGWRLIAFLLPVLTLIRYWPNLHWTGR